mgnify:CR=1 FL=1
MKKRILCLTLALIISGAQVVSVSATREDEAALQQEMDATNEQLNATYSRLDELSSQKSQIEGEISTLDANLVNVMVSIQTLEEISPIRKPTLHLHRPTFEKAQNAKAETV